MDAQRGGRAVGGGYGRLAAAGGFGGENLVLRMDRVPCDPCCVLYAVYICKGNIVTTSNDVVHPTASVGHKCTVRQVEGSGQRNAFNLNA